MTSSMRNTCLTISLVLFLFLLAGDTLRSANLFSSSISSLASLMVRGGSFAALNFLQIEKSGVDLLYSIRGMLSFRGGIIRGCGYAFSFVSIVDGRSRSVIGLA
ncbi:hypothetical protein Tco_0565232 [Tanacetum coccineum]